MLEADAQAALVGRGELVLRQRRLGADVEAARRAGPALRTQGVSGERGEGTAHGLCTEAHPNQRGPVLTVGHTLGMGHPDRELAHPECLRHANQGPILTMGILTMGILTMGLSPSWAHPNLCLVAPCVGGEPCRTWRRT